MRKGGRIEFPPLSIRYECVRGLLNCYTSSRFFAQMPMFADAVIAQTSLGLLIPAKILPPPVESPHARVRPSTQTDNQTSHSQLTANFGASVGIRSTIILVPLAHPPMRPTLRPAGLRQADLR
jgi:hypothetical protein